ncbi:hypothetical protein D3C71_2041850 [compost metagenome]
MPIVVAPATKTIRNRTPVGGLKPISAIEKAAATKKPTTTLGRPKRSPSQPPAMAPTMPPKFSENRLSRLAFSA